jgi:predicted dehydrogenase
MLGYEHAFSHQVKDFIDAIAGDTEPTPTFDDGVQVQRVLDAVEASSNDDSRWVQI